MRSLGGPGKGYYIHGDEIRKWFANDNSGVINDSPIMNWSPDEVARYGLELRLANNKIIATSQSYADRSSMNKGIKSVMTNAPKLKIS